MRHGAFGAMGGVQTSANDYARWVAFLLSAWPPRDGAEQGPVRRSSVRELAQGLNFPAVARRPGGAPEDCPQAAAYGMGMRVAVDCDLGLTLAHGGGYPGYGSFLLLLPERGVGIFAFANRTYAGPSPPVWQAALALHRAGLLPGRAAPVSEALAANYAAAGAMYQAGSLAPGQSRLAMNFLMDRSAENWAAEFARLKAQTGACRTDAPDHRHRRALRPFHLDLRTRPPPGPAPPRPDQPADHPGAEAAGACLESRAATNVYTRCIYRRLTMKTTKTFKSGNSIAVRLPKALGIEAGTEMRVREEQGKYVAGAGEAGAAKKIDLTGICGSMPGLKPLEREDGRF